MQMVKTCQFTTRCKNDTQ